MYQWRSTLVRCLSILAIAAGAAPAIAQAPNAERSTAFVGVHVIDVERGVVQRNQTVVVRGGRIAALGSRDSVALPDGAVLIEGRGRYLMPGLIDLHSHPIDPALLRLYLVNGVTTVQMLNAWPAVLHWADSASAPAPHVEACAGPLRDIDSVESARRIVAEQAALAFRCLKPYDDLSAEAFTALVSEARGRGIRTVAHIPRNLRWQDALHARPDAIAHAEEFLYSPIESAAQVDSLIDGMREGHIALIPTLANYDLITRQRVQLDAMLARPELAYVPAVERRAWRRPLNKYVQRIPLDRIPQMRRLYGFQRDLVRRIADAGGTILLGTDAGNSLVVPGYSVHEELVALTAAGLTPAAALRAATIDAARFLGVERGSIDVGRAADLVLVYGNPLEDVRDASLIAGTMVQGHWLPADTLSASLRTLREMLALEEETVTVFERDGLAQMLRWVEQHPRAGELRPRALDELAYQLWILEDRLEDAIRVFELNARLHADWPGAAESLRIAREALAKGADASSR